MTEQIYEKLHELEIFFPNNQEFRTWSMQSNLWNWLYSIMSINGEKIHKTQVVNLVQGNLVEDMPLSLYAFVNNFQDIYFDMNRYIGMQTSLEPKMISRWVKMLRGLDPDSSDEAVFRKNCNVVYEWDLIPVGEDRVIDEFNALVKEYVKSKDLVDPIKRAADFHLGINKLYPFGEDTVTVSMTILMFSILEMGLPVPNLTMSDREYNQMMSLYVENGSSEEFKGILERNLYNRIDSMLSLAKQASEKLKNE